MKKKIAFFAANLDMGGIERAIINFVNKIDKSKYEVTLFLEKKEGMYLNEVDKDIEIIDFNISRNKNVLLRKISNALKLLYFSIKYHNKFYFSANFATSIKSGAILAKRFSKNNAIWFHGEYWYTSDEAQKFIKYIRVKKYQKVVFVSNKIKEDYIKENPNHNQKLYVLNNIINYQQILKRSEEKIDLKKTKTTLLNVGRHEEKSKKLSMLLKTTKRLIDEKYDFDLWLVGSGPDTKMYQNMIKELSLEKNVKMLGCKSNVFPYYKKCDVVVLSSVREGNPVVYLEAKTLNKPIISTDVSDAKLELKNYGIVTKQNEDSLYQGLKKYLDEGYEIKEKFNPETFNQDKIKKLYNIIEE